MPVNEYGQIIGESMEGYTPGEFPSIDFLEGRYTRIEALSVEKHAGGFASCLWSKYTSGCGPIIFQERGRYGGNWLPF